MPMEREFIDEMMGYAEDQAKWRKKNQEAYEQRQRKIDKLNQQSRLWGMAPGAISAIGNIAGMGMGSSSQPPSGVGGMAPYDTTGAALQPQNIGMMPSNQYGINPYDYLPKR